MAMTVLWVAVLLLYGVSTGTAMKSSKPGGSNMKPGPSNMKPGPSNMKPGPSNMKPGPSIMKPGGSNNQPGGSNMKPGPSIMKPGPSIMKPGPSNNQPGASNNVELPLDMAPNSVDDMYSGCRAEMMKAIPKFLENDKNKDLDFKKAWTAAEGLYKWKRPPTVGREQTIAIYVYTFISGNMHRSFNAAVRSQGPQYKDKFGYHALHFLLTDAIQSTNARRLNQLDEGEDKCLTVYRRVNLRFRRNVANTQFRFGSFTSTSKGDYPYADVFGTESCFEIITCMGADISSHSKYQNEAEVLIPPYEIFKVTDVLEKSAKLPNLPCDVVYKVKSTEQVESNYNCALFQN